MVDEDEGSEGVGVCEVEDATSRAIKSVIQISVKIVNGLQADHWNAYVSRISAGSDMTPCFF